MTKPDQREPAEATAPVSMPRFAPVTATSALPMPRSLLTAGIVLDPETERERESRMESLKGELGRMIEQGKGAAVIDRVLSLVVDLERENERFAWRLLRELRYRFGRQTEKLSREELQQFLLAIGGDEAASKDADLMVPAPASPGDPDASKADNESEPAKPLKK